MLTEKKTGKYKKIAICKDAIAALQFYFPHRQGNYIFSNGRKEERPISRVQVWRIIHDAVEELNIPGQINLTWNPIPVKKQHLQPEQK